MPADVLIRTAAWLLNKKVARLLTSLVTTIADEPAEHILQHSSPDTRFSLLGKTYEPTAAMPPSICLCPAPE